MEALKPPRPSRIPLPSRPARSPKPTNIFPLKLVSNHLNISLPTKGSSTVCIYAVQIEPALPVDARREKRKIMETVKQQIIEDLGKYTYSGDNIVAFKKKEGQLLYKTKVDEKTEYLISIKNTYESSLSNLIASDADQARVSVQSINITIKQMMRNLQMFEIGRTAKFFYNDQNHIYKLQEANIQVRVGFKTSLQLLQGGPRLQVDYCTRVLRTDNALVFIKKLGGSQGQIADALIDRSVLADYGNYRNYRITDVDFKLSPKSKFTHRTGPITYAEYYQDSYKLKITDMGQPLLVCVIRERNPENIWVDRTVHLVPELCKMTGMEDEDRQNFNLMKELAQYTKLEPTQRMDEISNHIGNMNKEFKNAGYAIQVAEFATLNAHQINVPQLTLAKKEIIKPDGKGSFQLRSKIIEPMVLDYWILLYSGKGARYDEEAEKFYNNLAKAASTFGIKVVEPLYVNVGSIQGNDYADTLKKNMDAKVQAVIAFIPKAAKNKVYKAFKKACVLPGNPVPSQVVLTSSVFKNTMAVCSKIILQIAAKMGNSLWLPEMPERLPKDTMIIGADVFHNTFNRKQSVIGLCASYDPTLTKYYSRVKFQEKVGKEIMNNIGGLVADSIKKYRKMSKALPELIIFYRDGVGESQYQDVMRIEIPAIKAGFKTIDENYNPQFVEVVVTKKINDRFFVPTGKPGNGGNKYNNPPSGTLVMEGVTSRNYDFYLCAQKVTQGTCTPTHYTVVCNESTLPEDILAKLTYYQCFGYYNWMGAIRVPACVQYASKLANLAGSSLGVDPDEKLWDKLHFL